MYTVIGVADKNARFIALVACISWAEALEKKSFSQPGFNM